MYEFAVQKPSTVKRLFFLISFTVNAIPALYAYQLSYDSNFMILRKVVILWFTIAFSCTDATTLVKRVYGAWEHVYLPVLSFSIHIEQRHVNITVLFNFWFETVNNCDTYCIDNLNNPPIMFFVSNIYFNSVRIFTRNIYLHCTDISDKGVQMFLRTNDKNN